MAYLVLLFRVFMQTRNSYSSNHQNVARVLLRFAWTIEAFAVVTGLTISWIVATDTYEKNKLIDTAGSVTDWRNVFLSAVPFVMVSIVELAKIPTAQAIYATKNLIWKWVFICALLFLALITFETFLNGFERNYRALNFQVSEELIRLDVLYEKLATLNSQVVKDSEVTRAAIVDQFDYEQKQVALDRDSSLEALAEQEGLIRVKAGNVLIGAIRDDIDKLQDDKESMISSRNAELDALRLVVDKRQTRANNEARSQLELLKEQVAKEEVALSDLNREKAQAESTASFFNRSAVVSRYTALVSEQRERIDIARDKLEQFSLTERVAELLQGQGGERESDAIYQRYDTRLSALEKRITDKSNELARLTGVTQADIEREQARLNDDRQRIMTNYEYRVQELEARKAFELAEFSRVEDRLVEVNDEIRLTEAAILLGRSNINELAKDNQIFRIAKMFSPEAKTVVDVKMSMVDLVSKVWFGSLAAVIALTGIILALASQVVGDSRNTQPGRHGLAGALRSVALASNRRTRRQPKEITKVEVKEVVKEVPVDKVVFRDVVRDVIRRELVHVPSNAVEQRYIEHRHEPEYN